MQMYSNARAKSCHVEFIFFFKKEKKEKKSQVHKTNKTIYYIQYTTLLPLFARGAFLVSSTS